MRIGVNTRGIWALSARVVAALQSTRPYSLGTPTCLASLLGFQVL